MKKVEVLPLCLRELETSNNYRSRSRSFMMYPDVKNTKEAVTLDLHLFALILCIL